MNELCKTEHNWSFAVGTSKAWLFHDSHLILMSLQSHGALLIQCDISRENIFVSSNHSFQSELCLDFTSFLETKQLTDVTIITNDEKLRAHQIVLARKSPVFLDMFDNDMPEKRPNVVEINDFDSSVIKVMLRFMYTGEVENMNDVAEDLFLCADKYSLSELKKICEIPQSLHKALSGRPLGRTGFIMIDVKEDSVMKIYPKAENKMNESGSMKYLSYLWKSITGVLQLEHQKHGYFMTVTLYLRVFKVMEYY
ncbi:speckle-type POZ protein-like [Copidosoma floridanum]|uniref:speckle-type POZ protein-like n=1 Tax=Copidosoma floridanum TaxID=29053 RepID=UPI000C6F4647|nr:speckle-type POZ protein-like [Copidosoma floridanum]